MTLRSIAAVCALGIACALTFGVVPARAAEPATHQQEHKQEQEQALALTPDVLNLLRAEMREITTGVQSIPVSLAGAQWQSIQEVSARIRDSYVMQQQLTAAQAAELEHALPEHFQRMDRDFHRRATQLGAAAATHDYELVAFHYARLIEQCAQCHAAYARARFPGFVAPEPAKHGH